MKYYCGECEKHLQPKDGYDLLEFHEHNFGHVQNALRQNVIERYRFEECLKYIDELISDPAHSGVGLGVLKYLIGHYIDLSFKREPRAIPEEIKFVRS